MPPQGKLFSHLYASAPCDEATRRGRGQEVDLVLHGRHTQGFINLGPPTLGGTGGINLIRTSSMTSKLDDIKAFAKRHLTDARGSHAWDHTLRVYNLCMHIGRVEGADLEVLEIAAYLHDVARPLQDQSKGGVCHAKKGAEMAHSLLTDYPISEDRKGNVIHCILSHRFRGNCHPETLEAKVLFDADKLDSIGAIGVARTFQFAGEVGAKLHNPSIDPEDTQEYTEEDTGYREFKLKLSKIKERMLTAEGHRIARERHPFMEGFFKRFLQEHEGYL